MYFVYTPVAHCSVCIIDADVYASPSTFQCRHRPAHSAAGWQCFLVHLQFFQVCHAVCSTFLAGGWTRHCWRWRRGVCPASSAEHLHVCVAVLTICATCRYYTGGNIEQTSLGNFGRISVTHDGDGAALMPVNGTLSGTLVCLHYCLDFLSVCESGTLQPLQHCKY